MRTVEVKVFRFNPSVDQEPRFEIHKVPLIEGSSVSNILQYINEEYDGGLAHYLSCRRGICAECMVKVNGKPALACTEIVRGDITIEPIKREWVIKGLLIIRPKRDDYSDK
jgi:succinate dehydrogenase/fumarate reductase-like Fe-S protein